MKRHVIVAAGVATASLLALATPAQAGPLRSCSAWYLDGLDGAAVGATGGGSEQPSSRTHLDNVNLRVTDTRADGHHVAVRLVTRRSDGTDHYWAWHSVYSGANTSDSWDTSATDSGGIRLVWQEVGVFEGDSKLGSCYTQAYSGV
ncbi:hypothetical protein ACIGDI_01975 [Streptomyces sp. NPDC085900]|uniref:hypothetical protein n=1 Tax=Streptomyces sp. NPDC085900 TaxID=3365737 RepID=UPI0037CF1845